MRIASCRAEGRQAQRFRHGGAGTIQPDKGHPQLAHGVITGGALGLQVPREGKLHLLFGNARFAQAMAGAALLQHAFGLLPAGAALGIKARILHQLIKAPVPAGLRSFLPPTAAQAASTGGCGNITVSPLRIGITGNPLSGLFGLSVPQRAKKYAQGSQSSALRDDFGVKIYSSPNTPAPTPRKPVCRTPAPGPRW